MADDINLPNLVSHLQVNLANTGGVVADASRQGSAVGAALGESLQRRVQAAVNDIPPVVITDDSNGFDRDLDRVRRELQQLGDQRIGVDISVDEALRRMNELEPHLDRLARTHPDITVRASVADAAANLADLRAAARAVPDEIRINADVDSGAAVAHTALLTRLVNGLGDSSRGLGSAMLPLAGTLAKTAAGFGAVTPVAAGLASTLLNIIPAAGVAATGIIAAGVAGAAFKIGISGVGDAVKEAFSGDDPEKLAAALKKLSPNARAFVGVLQDLKPKLDALKIDVQDRLFKDLDSTFQTTARKTLPLVSTALRDSAGTLNLMGRQVLNTATGLAESGALGKALKSATKGFAGFSQLPAVVVQGLVQVGAAAGPSFEKLGKSAQGALGNISDKIAESFASGGMQRAIEHAIDLIKQLAKVGGNVASIIFSIFSAGAASGGGMLGVLQSITGELAKVVKTKGVQDALKALFETMGTLGKTIAPLLGQALSALGPVLTALGPPAQTLITALGDALSPIITALGPVLEDAAVAVGALVTALAPLLPVIGDMVAALLPALSPLLDACVTVFEALGTVLTDQVVPVLQDTLAPLLAELPTIIGPLADLLARNLVVALQVFGDLLVALGPALVTMSQSLADLLVAVAPLIVAFTDFTNKAIAKLGPYLPPLINLVGKLASFLAGTLAKQITTIVIPAVTAIANLLQGDFSGAWRNAKTAVTNAAGEMISRATAIPRLVIGALSSLGGKLYDLLRSAFGKMAPGASSRIGDLTGLVHGIPGRVRGALGDLGGLLASAGRSLIQGLVNGINSKIASVKSTLQSLTGKLTDWKGPKHKDATLLTPAGKSLIKGLVDGIDASTASLKSKLGQVTTLIEKAINTNSKNRNKVSGLSSLLSTVEKDNKQILKLAATRDAVAKKLDAATKKLSDLQKASAKVQTDITSGILSDADITKSGQQVNSVSAITVQLQQSVKAAQQFAANIAKLKKAGLRGDLLQEIADAGVAGGAATAQALANATPAELKKINDLQTQLASAAKKTGTTVADSLYASGIKAAAGIVAGLKSQEKNIEKQMEKIATAMVKAIKKKLGIHSPARALIPVGVSSGQGVIEGWEAMRAAISRTAASVTGAAVTAAQATQQTISTPMPTASALSGTYAVQAAGAAASAINYIHLYGSDATPEGILRALSWNSLVGRK